MEAITRLHLQASLAGEAMAALRYALFADQAAAEGLPDAADLFREIGDQERSEHFREIAALLGLVGSTRQNLESALAGEITEHRRVYPMYAGEAHRYGDDAVAARYIELGADEHLHADRLRGALAALDALVGAY